MVLPLVDEHKPKCYLCHEGFENIEKLKNEINWYKLIPNQIKIITPRIISSRINKNPNLVMEHIDFSTLNFAPDSTPLEIESLINDGKAGQYTEISQNLNSLSHNIYAL